LIQDLLIIAVWFSKEINALLKWRSWNFQQNNHLWKCGCASHHLRELVPPCFLIIRSSTLFEKELLHAGTPSLRNEEISPSENFEYGWPNTEPAFVR
jgi:hypothetical protein